MANNVFSSFLEHTSDATYRVWVAEILTQLDAINPSILTRTADTGQVNTATVTRPAINTANAYAEWLFNDGQTNLYIKLEFGTAGAATAPQMWITVGTTTNGSGTVGGAATVRVITTSGSAPISTVTNYASYLCVATGTFSLCWKAASMTGGGVPRASGFFALNRSVTDAGVPNSDGYQLNTATSFSANTAQAVNLATSTVLTTTTKAYTLRPFGITSTLVGGVAQYFRHFIALPLCRPLGHICTVLNAEYAAGTQFPGETGSITDHNFLSLGTWVPNASPVVDNNDSFAIAWI